MECEMRMSYPDVKTMGLLFLGSLLVSSMPGCATAPTYYWIKHGVSKEQIYKDNFFCADMTAKKPDTYPYSREWFYFATLDQPAYRQCMVSRGYQMVSKEDLERGVLPVTPEQRLGQHMLETQKICERVVGGEGDISSCVRWMNFGSSGNVPSTSQFQAHDLLEQQNSRIGIGKSEKEVCAQFDPNDTNVVRITINKSCDPNGPEAP
jgi:hypothetical protein